MEDFQLQHSLESRAGSAGFTWYGLAGEALGKFAAEYVVNHQIHEISFSLLDKAGSDALQGKLSNDGKELSGKISGILPTEWINTLVSWFDLGSYRIIGAPPSLDFQMETISPLPKGTATLQLNGLGLDIPGTNQINGINGSVSLALNGLPRSAGSQVLTIDSISTSIVDIEDIHLNWNLLSIRHLEINQLHGKIGSGHVEVEPFTVDPMNPEIVTTIRFTGVEGDLIRRILGEERFSLNGTVTGQIQVGFRNGELVLGQGRFDMDTRADQ